MSTATTYRNAVGLSPDNFKQLDKVLVKLHEHDAELCERLVRYLVDGEGEAVLSDLAKVGDSAQKLQMGCSQQYGGFGGVSHPFTWRAFFRDVQTRDLDFYMRVAQMFEAAARHLPADRFFCQAHVENNKWLELLLQEATQTTRGYFISDNNRKTRLYAAEFIKMIEADGRTADAFLTAPFRAGKGWEDQTMRNMILSVSNLGSEYAARRDLIAPFLVQGNAESRVTAIENLAKTKTPPEPFAAELVACATESSKTLREAAAPLVRAMPAAAQPLLEGLTKSGNRTQREHAVRLLGRICGEKAHDFLRTLRETEKSAPVLEVIAAALSEVETAAASAALDLSPPPRQPIELEPPVTPALRQTLEAMFVDYNQKADRHNDLLANKQANQHVYPNRELKHVEAQQIEQVCRMLERGGKLDGILRNALGESRYAWGEGGAPYMAFFEHPDCQLIHAVRLLAMIRQIDKSHAGRSGIEHYASIPLETFRNAHQPAITLDDLAEAVRGLGLSDDVVLDAILDNYWHAFDWEPESVWPFLLTKLDRLVHAFSPSTSRDYAERWRHEREQNGAFRLLAKFPIVPPALVGKLWEFALSTSKSDRHRAQPICAKLPDLAERLLPALGSGNFQTRQVAAEWLGRVGDKRAIAPLTAAAKKEKQDAAMDALLTALERLGESVEPFLDRDKLQADAVKNLKKGTPPALEWLPWTALPKVRWQDTGEAVPAETLIWLIVQSHKLKNPEAGPLLRRYCEKFRPADREALGNFVLTAWLDHDLKRKHSDDECRKLAQQQAPQRHQSCQQLVQYYTTKNQPIPAGYQLTLQQCEDQIFAELQREVGTAASEKGVLAVASACCGDAAVGPVQKYLKDWYGYRAAQCKSLIAMLSGVDRPLAIQYLLSISNRFRTKGIREEAEKYVSLLAERKGWTLDELADRTMPTCGLDDEGKLELSYGTRTFSARVNVELDLVIYDAEGKALKKLPDPRKEDDAELAKAAKKTLSAAKTELKKFVDLTTTRLYEAMCTERTWPAADWQMYLHEHPLARLLCQRLIWAVLPKGEQTVVSTFRPLDDGSLTDVVDNSVELPEDAQIRIAHSCNLPTETSQAWATHLADYNIAPLFTQFGREPYDIPEGKRRETAIEDFEGHMLEAFKLRGLATKFGYIRGQAEDGGWFHEYLKSFTGLGLEVHLGFTGNGLPEENRNVALTSLTFEKKAREESPAMMFRRGHGVPLSEIPAVLLAECVGDLRTIAASGTGFDPEWEKKAYL